MKSHKQPKQPKFDMSGVLTSIPTSYLIATLKHGAHSLPDLANRIGEELKVRGVSMNHYIRREVTSLCDVPGCEKIALYIIGKFAVCGIPEHKQMAEQRRKAFSAKIDQESKRTDAGMDAADKRLKQRQDWRSFNQHKR